MAETKRVVRHTLVDPGVATTHATKLLGWRRWGDQLSLTFIEERGDEDDPSKIRAHVVSRVAVPLSTVEHMIGLLQEAKAHQALSLKGAGSDPVN